MLRLQALFSALLALFASSALATIISTFSDHNCKNSFQVFDGPDGFPNGTCVQLKSHGAYGSFQVTQLDNGCGVTVYKKDATAGSPCSDLTPILADLGSCYNSTYVYFSIDNCIQPDPTTAGTGDAALSTAATATATTAAATATTASSSSSSSAGGSSTNVGAIVGGVLGGVFGLALIALAAWFLWLRDGRARSQPPSSPRGGSVTDLGYPVNKGGDPGNIAETGTAVGYTTAGSTTAGGSSVGGTVAASSISNGRVQELEPSPSRAEMPTTGTWTKYELSSTETGRGEPKYYAELPGHQQ